MTHNLTQRCLEIRPENIPDALKGIPSWIRWTVGKEKSDGRYDKIPVNKHGYAANAHDPKNWYSFSDALKQIDRKFNGGIAFDLSGEPISSGDKYNEHFLIGGDLDLCVSNYVEGEPLTLDERAQKVLALLKTYYEVSTSGTGIRFFVACSAPPKNKNKDRAEIYFSGRFLTITGHGSGEIKIIGKETLAELESIMFPQDRTAHDQSQSYQQKQRPLFSHQTNQLNNGPVETKESVGRMVSALSAIPANIGRRTWCDILYSVKAHGFICGENEARNWSKTAGTYDLENNRHGYDEKAFNDVWKYPAQSIGPGTLYHHAKQYGWLGKQLELFATAEISTGPDIYGDVFNGKFFAKNFADRMVYCYPRSKWLKFNGMVWEWCDSGEELQAAKHVAMNIAKYAAEVFSADPTNPNSKKLIQHAQNTQNLNKLQAMLQTAAAELGMGIGSMTQIDRDSMLLGCKNGIVCLNTGALLVPDPKMLITRQVNSEFNPEAHCPIWLRFLDQCFISDEETIDYIQKALGYSLTGMVGEEVLHFCFGMGRNGKSVFANVMTKLMGDYAITAPAEMLMRRDRNGATNDIARLCGSRLVLANETRSDQRFDDLTIKTLVSTERISARFLHNEFFDFWPTFKIWIRGNHKPVITDESNGAWRRIRLVPFENNITEDRVDSELEKKLLAEKEGILAWMIEGALKWKQEGLKPSPRIRAASNQYRTDCDVIGDFIEENCSTGTDLKISQSNLWILWQGWAKDNGYFCGSKKTFTRRLKDRGINPDGYLNGSRAYVGISLKSLVRPTTPSQDVMAKPVSLYE
jgi:P4 family phage/plasmid primase-like protien